METISPFELKNKLIEMADESIKKMAHTMLNAGRGNPNWIATEPREAFFLLGKFGLCECRRVQSLEEGIAGRYYLAPGFFLMGMLKYSSARVIIKSRASVSNREKARAFSNSLTRFLSRAFSSW